MVNNHVVEFTLRLLHLFFYIKVLQNCAGLSRCLQLAEVLLDCI